MTTPSIPLWSLAHIGLKFPGAALIAGAAFFVLADDSKPMVAITFDDGRESSYARALTYMSERDAIGTTYITTDLLGKPGYITSGHLKAFVAAEWEIGAHGKYHDDFTSNSPDQLAANLIDPVRDLAKLSGQEILSVATPYGAYNDVVKTEIEKVYFNHVTAVNGWDEAHGLNVANNFDPYQVKRIDITSDVSAEQVCNRVSTLPEDSLYVILFHNITDEPGKYNTSISTFESIVDCITKSDVNLVRVSDGVEAMRLKSQ